MVESNEMINLQLDDGSVVPVPKDAAIKSALVAAAFEEDEDAEDLTVPIKEVSKETLNYVIEYLVYIKDNDEIKIESPLTKPLDEILGKFLSFNSFCIANTWWLQFVNKLTNDQLL